MELSNPIGIGHGAEDLGFPLTDLERRLGTDIVRVEEAPGAADTVVRALDLYDQQSGDSGGPGVLLCLISAHEMRTEELHRALAEAAARGCVGIATKRSGDDAGDAELERLAHAGGLSTVTIAASVNWREFDALVTRILGEHGRSLAIAPSTGDKLFALANTIAAAFDGSVAIEDYQRQILAHSSVDGQAIDALRTTGILFRRAGDAPVNESRYRAVLESSDIVRFPSYGDSLPRAAIAIRAGAIPLGTIWVLDPGGEDPGDAPLDTERAELLRRGATLAADALMESWQLHTRTASRREAAFSRMVTGAGQPGDREELDPSGESLGVVLSASVTPGAQAAGVVAEARAVLTRHLAVYVPDLVVTSDGTELLILCPTERVEQLREWVLTASAELSAEASERLRIGLSNPRDITTRLPYAVGEARETARHSRAAGEQVGTVSRLRTQLFLAACRSQLELDDRLVLPEVSELLASGTSGEQLAITLECWLAEAGNVARTAERLRVHEQTVRYRLRKLRERVPFGTSGDDYLLTLWAQLRMLRGA